MRKYKLNKRKQAPFGTQEAATLAAAGISAAATIAGAATNAKAIKEQAKQQAQSTLQQAQAQTNALQKINLNNNQIKEQEVQAIKDQNEEANQLAKDTQMTLQMLAGQQNENARLEGAKIQVKCGGSLRKRGLQGTSLLRGSYSPTLDFTVTDGGGVIPLGSTNNGELYEIKGNDHNHYHKTKGGKSKTGVGIKFATGEVIEGEGNQNSNLGELLYVTPDDGKFISKHTIRGFNPAKAVLSGMSPEEAFNIQETIKDIYNIPDNGKSNKALLGKLATTTNRFNNINNMITDSAGVVYLVNKPKLKYGGRTKAPNGLNLSNNPNNWWYYKNNNIDDYGISRPTTYNTGHDINGFDFDDTTLSTDNFVPAFTAGSTSPVEENINPYTNFANRAQLTGAGITLGANFLSAGISNKANRRAASILTKANDQATALRAYGLSQLQGIDPNVIDRNSFRTGHMLATVRAPYVNVSPEMALIERSRQRIQNNARNNSISSAAMNNRFNKAEVDAYDQRSQVYSKANQLSENIKQENAKALTEAAKTNAILDTQALKDYNTAKLDVAKYNNEIRNEKARGIPDLYADNLGANGQIRSNLLQSIGNNIAEANLKGGMAFANTVSGIGKQEYDKQNIMLGIDSDIATRSALANNDRMLAYNLYSRFKNSSNPSQQQYADELRKQFNFQAKNGTIVKRRKLKNTTTIK